MKKKLAIIFLILAIGLLAARLTLKLQQIREEDTPILDPQFDETYPPENVKAMWREDEARRIRSVANDETFTSDGRWKLADPDPAGTWARQKKALGW
jgi:hypothetical protein